MSLSAGWATPVNSIEKVVHWWRPDDRQACKPTSSIGYSGPRNGVGIPDLVCLDCLGVISDAQETLGVTLTPIYERVSMWMRRSAWAGDDLDHEAEPVFKFKDGTETTGQLYARRDGV